MNWANYCAAAMTESFTPPPVATIRAVAPTAPILQIDELLNDRSIRVIVCCGAGGVGKTTAAAALALRAAENGRKAVVLTIDPARRLAQSLGLQALDNEPREVTGLVGEGSLHAMMLDMKRTFDEMVEAHADREKADTILHNPFYQALSSSFAGTQEYMAMEKLGQLRAASESGQGWDLIVVDTPPSRSALDFLDAPKRLGSFLDGRFIRILLMPARIGGKAYTRALSLGMGVFSSVLGKVLGASVLTDLQIFVAAFETLFGGFRERADKTYRTLQGADTRFLVVAAPERDALREASYFVERLAEEKMPHAGLVLNRVQAARLPSLSAGAALAAAQRLAPEQGTPTFNLLLLHADRSALADRQRELAKRFTTAHPGVPVMTVGALATDVHDLAGLRRIGEMMSGREEVDQPT